jgi:predicted metalloprotease with PDZ domain
MIMRAFKALAPGAAVLLLLTTCGAQKPTGEEHNVMTQLSQSFARGPHLSQEWGMVVSDVSPGSSAEKAGLEVQDLILAMDGTSAVLQIERQHRFEYIPIEIG